jgi:hypothetical protein
LGRNLIRDSSEVNTPEIIGNISLVKGITSKYFRQIYAIRARIELVTIYNGVEYLKNFMHLTLI